MSKEFKMLIVAIVGVIIMLLCSIETAEAKFKYKGSAKSCLMKGSYIMCGEDSNFGDVYDICTESTVKQQKKWKDLYNSPQKGDLMKDFHFKSRIFDCISVEAVKDYTCRCAV